MDPTEKYEASAEDWENGALGNDENTVRRSTVERTHSVDEKLGLQLISIRLQKSLIDQLKFIAQARGIGYQPLIRDLLHRFARAEMIDLAHELQKAADAQRQVCGDSDDREGRTDAFVQSERKRKKA